MKTVFSSDFRRYDVIELSSIVPTFFIVLLYWEIRTLIFYHKNHVHQSTTWARDSRGRFVGGKLTHLVLKNGKSLCVDDMWQLIFVTIILGIFLSWVSFLESI